MNLKQYLINKGGFSLVELIIAISIIGILAAVAYSNFRVTKEKLACKAIYSAMQTAKMRAISTGDNAYVDFDMDDDGSVFGGFFTAYLDTDEDAASFGETNNANGENEFTESNVLMPDCVKASGEIVRSETSDITDCIAGTRTGVALPIGISFGGTAASGGTMGSVSPWGAIQDDGVTANGERFRFTPTGVASPAGSVYLYDTTDSRGVGCAVRVSLAGLIRMENWDGSNWD